MEKGSTKVTVMYPTGDGLTFDFNYYLNTHVPMVQELLGDAVKAVTIEKGLGSMEPGSAPAYAAMINMYFDSVEAFEGAFGPAAERIVGDMPNYTNAQPVIQISEVLF